MSRDGLLAGGALTLEWSGAGPASVSISGHRAGTATLGSGSATFPHSTAGETTWDFSENCTVTVVVTYLSIEILNRDYRIHDSSETRIETGVDFDISMLEKVLAAILIEGGGSVGAETTRATGAEATLQADIDTRALDADLTDEVDRATAAEAAAQAYAIDRAHHTGSQAESTVTNLVSDLAAKALAADLTTETSRATAAEGVLTTNVNTRATSSDLTTETTRATAAEVAVTTNLATEVTRAGAAEVALQNLTNSTFVTGLDNAFARLSGVQAVVSASGALVTGSHNPVDASAGSKTMTLADAPSAGLMVAVSKKDSSVNTVTISVAHLRDGGAGSITLVGQYESLLLTSKADGTWWPVGDHKTKAYLDAAYARGFNVKTYGATGDGSTNDSTAIQNAINAASVAGGEVFIPAGSYVAYNLGITASNVVIRGAGKGKTILLNTATGEGIYAFGTSGAKISAVEIRDLSIVCTTSGGNQRCIYTNYVDNVLITDCALTGPGNNAVNLYNSKNGRVINNDISACKNFGVLAYLCTSATISGNYIFDMPTLSPDGHFAIELKDSKGCTANNNRIDNIAGPGIYCFSDGTLPDGNHVISNNVITNLLSGGSQAAAGVSTNTSYDNLIANNRIDTVAGTGISISPTSRSVVTGNAISNVTGPGIGTATAVACSILGNTITGCNYGIFLGTGTTRTKVANNTIVDVVGTTATFSPSGIRVVGTTTVRNTIVNNEIVDTRGGSAVQKYGILEESSGADYNIYSLNRASGSIAGGGNITVLGTNSVSLNNYTT